MRSTERDGARRSLLGFARGVVRAVSTRAGQAKMQHLDVDMLAGEKHEGAEHVEPYGFTVAPYPGAEVFVGYIGGNRAHPIILSVADRKYRLQGLAAGEVAIYDDLGQKVHLTRGGIVLSSPSITINGDLIVNGAVSIVGSALTHNGKNVGEDHAHSGVTPGGADTGPPV